MSSGSERSPEPFLEVDPNAPAPAPSAVAPAAEPYLERADADPSPAGAKTRKKVRAEDRASASASADAVSVMVVTSLQADRPLAAALWPDVKPADLLRSPPPPAAFAARCEWAQRAIDAVGRKDDESRARAVVAQRALEHKLSLAASRGPTPRDAALAELEADQLGELVELAHVLGGASREIAGANLTRLDEAAAERGIDARRAREHVRTSGYALLEAEARGWSAFTALPGAPATMDAVAITMLQHPVQAAESVRSGAVLGWLRENNAAPELLSRARDARMMLERTGTGSSEALAVHSQAWAFGRRELIAGNVWLRAPGEIAAAVRAGSLTLDDLARSAREGVLSAWLRMHGWVAASGAADLVARSQESGMKRLAWSLGEPLILGELSFVDPPTLARTALSTPSLRAALVAAHASGDLLAWLESLSPALRDEQWIERLRRGREAHPGDEMPLWMGVYAQARAATLALRSAAGHPASLTSPGQLKITTMVAELWDDLKRAYRTGELQAWLAQSTTLDFKAIPRPPVDEDAELNALLWTLGHTGLVLEWGLNDFAVTSVSDLVRAYQSGWQQVESQLARGHILAWLERFHGDRVLGGVTVRDLSVCLRAEVGKLPSGFAALKLALLCGMRYLPLDPCNPGDQANFRGYSAVARGTGDPRAWEPLHEHLTQGTALLWLAQQPAVAEVDARAMLALAFQTTAGKAFEPPLRRAARLTQPHGDPVPSPALAQELTGAIPQTRPLAVVPKASPKPSRGAGRWFFGPVGLALLGASAVLWQHEREQPLVPDAALVADNGRSVPVAFDVTATVPAMEHGDPWDFDRSPPDLRVYIVGPGGPKTLGNCLNSTECTLAESGTLEPRREFDLVVREVDPWAETEVCRARIRWTGGRDDSVHARPDGCELRLRIRRMDTAPALRTPTAPRRPAADVPDGGRTDAGATPVRRPSRRATGLHKVNDAEF